ncbi:MAG: CDP-glycerol glycerophosphotransferase family protein [Lachnospiraceae bacterium]|nr:CDP-glycerol glycerophosphotransferase family protein [Lachnospiraceae bacterium]
MFRIKQWIKMLLQNIVLPLVYFFYSRRPVEPGLVIFADAHHEEIPFSMRRMYDEVRQNGTAAKRDADGIVMTGREADARDGSVMAGREVDARDGSVMTGREADARDGSIMTGEEADAHNCSGSYRIELFVTDFDRLSFGRMAKYLLRFMRRYAAAEYVFICDYFLPVSSCRKRPETKVVQLWHSCGLTKKIAYDADEDIPKGYHGDMFGNYSYLTMSADACVPVHERALRLSREHIFATGISRTDYYFDEKWNERCRENFRKAHPEAEGRRIAVWAPTFRGNAAAPRLEGLDIIRRAAEELKDEWYFVIKAHPHIDRHGMVSTSRIPTEELFPVADVLITDYSSVLFDYLLYRRPVILFAPDLQEYEQARGFYIDYRSIPYPLTRTREELEAVIGGIAGNGCADHGKQDWYAAHAAEIDAFRETYVGACDGHATERILKLVGLQ